MQTQRRFEKRYHPGTSWTVIVFCDARVSQASILTFRWELLHRCIRSALNNVVSNVVFQSGRERRGKIFWICPEKIHSGASAVSAWQKGEFNHQCDGWTCTRYVTPPSLCRLQHSVVTVPGDHHVHLSSPEVVAPAVSHFLRTKVLLLPTSATHKLWSGRQKQPRRRHGVLGSVGIRCSEVYQELHYFTVWPDIAKILFNPVGRTGNEFDKELPVKRPSLVCCLFVVSPCSGRLSLCARNNFTPLCYVSEAEECRYRSVV